MRTEEEVLKDFEKLGYKVDSNDDEMLVLVLSYKVDSLEIVIDKKCRIYTNRYTGKSFGIPVTTNMIEHQLLNELFNLWGWINEEH